MHDNWHRQYESLHQTQASSFQAYVFNLYNDVAVFKTFKPYKAEASSNPSSGKDAQNQDHECIVPANLAKINSLMEMGFDRKMAKAALEIGKDNLVS